MEKPALSRMTRDATRIKEEAFILLIMIISFIQNISCINQNGREIAPEDQ
jgi:hypothetical protein